MDMNENCKCPFVDCKHHGNCEACGKNHRRSFCRSPKWMQKFVVFMSGIQRKKQQNITYSANSN
jgi:hypothetical protein